jgi:hypothetical protein
MTMAWTCLVTSQHERARTLLDELGQVVAPGSWAQGYHVWLTADLALDEGNVETARALYAQGRSIAEATGEPRLNIAWRVGMSRYHRAVDDGPTARA